MNTLTIIIVLIVGIVLGSIFSIRKSNKQKGLIYQQIQEKQENKDKILRFLNSNERIVNNDVEKLLGVSDSTATRYLDELEKEDKINQIGKTGSAVYYQLK